MNLRQFHYFIAVAEEGHITRAAQRLNIQQPPLSQQIKALETELAVQLFHRRPRGVELTPAGAAFLEHARIVLDEVERAKSATRRTARGEQGRVAVGFTSSAPFHPLVPRVIRAYRESSPLVSLVLEESGSRDLVQAVHEEKLDAAFIRSSVADMAGLTVRPLLQEEMLVAFPAGHALARSPRRRAGGPRRKALSSQLKLQALAGETFVLYKRPNGPGLYDAIISACRQAGFSPRIGQEAPRITSTLNLVAAGLGVTIVPASLRRLSMDGVVYRKLGGDLIPKAPMIIASRERENSPALKRFIELAERTAAEMTGDE
jgi:DNA-binding transcriptional LysR family regulator